MNTRKLAIALSLFTMLLCLLYLPATAQNDSPYGIDVAGIPVTADNKGDILGDGTASFDFDSLTLTLNNYQAEGYDYVNIADTGKTPQYIKISVLSIGEDDDIKVIIRGDCHFPFGIRVDHGTVAFVDATVSFGEQAYFCVDAYEGNLLIENSRLTVQGTDYFYKSAYDRTAVCAFNSLNLSMKDSTLICNAEKKAISFNDAFLSVYNECRIENSGITLKTPFPAFDSVISSQEGDITLSDTTVSIEDQNTVFYAPNGAFVAKDDCHLTISECNDAFMVGAFVLDNCRADISVYYNAFFAEAESMENAVIIKDSHVALNALSFETMTENRLAPYWTLLPEEGRAEFDGFTGLKQKIKTENYDPFTAVNCGILLHNGGLSLEKSKIEINGFKVGIGAHGDTGVQLMSGLRLSFDTEIAAFAVFSENQGAFIEKEKTSSHGNRINEYMMSDAESGKNITAYTYSPENEAVFTNASFSTFTATVLSMQGAASTLKITTGGHIPSWVWVSMGCLLFVALIAVLYFTVIRTAPKREKKQYKVQETQKRADYFAPTEPKESVPHREDLKTEEPTNDKKNEP